MKIITKQQVQEELRALNARREKQIREGVTPFVIDNKIKAMTKYLDYDMRARELEHRVSVANLLVGHERYGIYQGEVYDWVTSEFLN